MNRSAMFQLSIYAVFLVAVGLCWLAAVAAGVM